MSAPTKPTTVSQLIEWLSELDPDAAIYVDGYEGGYHDAGRPQCQPFGRDESMSPYFGPHADGFMSDGAATRGYLIPRRDDR